MVSLIISKIPQINCQTSPISKNNKSNSINITTEKVVICKDSIRLKTLDGCKLHISRYKFDYNAQGGRGSGRRLKVLNLDDVEEVHDDDHQISGETPVSRYDVDIKTVHIPPVSTTTAKIDGWAPFPPFVKVEIVPELLQGSICEKSGKVEFNFRAKFWMSIGSSYKAPPMAMDTVLTSEELKRSTTTTTTTTTTFRRSKIVGNRLSKDGKCKLVGVAKLDPTNDPYINSVLGLPAECLATLNVAMFFL